VPEDVGLGQHERLVVDVEADDLGVGRVDDRLPGLREAEGVFRIGQVSWNPLMYVPYCTPPRPSSRLPRRPRYPLPTAKFVSATPCSSGVYSVSTRAHSSIG
jgi:hypothetical protein